MRSQAFEHGVLGSVVVVTLLWLDLLPAEVLGHAVMLLLAWAAISTLLVATAGAWIAIARTRHARQRLSPRH
jgi:hypothetical protein